MTNFLNEQPVNLVQVRQLVRQATKSRIEKLVWVAGDKRLTYGDVTNLIGDLESDTPDLILAIATESEIDLVDPDQIRRFGNKHPHDTSRGNMPCVFISPKL